MPVTEFGRSSVHNVQHWSRTTLREAISRTFWRALEGAGPQACIQRLTDLERGAGDLIKYDILYQMDQYGVEGDSPIAGFEEALTYAQDSVRVDQRRIAHAFRRMSQQRTIHDLRADARENLADRWAVIKDEIMFAQLAGVVGNNSGLTLAVAEHGGNTLVDAAGDADHYINESGANLGITTIEKCMVRANTINPLIRPGKNLFGASYVFICHPYDVHYLRTATGSNEWREMTKFAFMGKGEATPFHKYVVGMWGDTVILTSRYIRRTGNVSHNLFLGAQAGVCAYANAYAKVRQNAVGGGGFMSWAERLDDYGNEMGVATGSVFGLKACRFTNPKTATAHRFGMIRVDNLAANPA